MPTCTRAHIVVDSLHVINSSVTTTTEPGSYAEWYLTFNVNGQIAKWSDDYVADDKVYAINRTFDVQLQPHTKVVITVTGYEHDSTSANDTLPTLVHETYPEQDWEIDGTYTVASPTTEEGSYQITYTVTCGEGQGITAAREYLGVYQPGLGEQQLPVASWDGFIKKRKELSSHGMRLTRISTFRRDKAEWTFGDGTERVFAGVFSPGTDDHYLWVAPWQSFEAKWKELRAKNFRLVDLAPYEDNGNMVFAGVFREGSDRNGLWVAPWESFQNKWKEWSDAGLRLVSFDTYVSGGKRYFTGVYRAGTYGHYLWVGVDWKSFQAKDKELGKTGLRLVDVASYAEGGQQRFAGVWRADKDVHPLVRQTWREFVKDWNKRRAAGSQLISMDTFQGNSET